jgi:ABC-2 type transport system ATP-binding protein
MSSIVGENIHVEFPIYDLRMRSLKHTFGLGQIARGLNRLGVAKLNVGGAIGVGEEGRVVIKALDGVSFEIQQGDRIGLLGHNGSGKTTLLRTLAGIYEPVTGEMRTNGRVVPLFDLQLGMDTDATGIENIWMRSRLLGLTNEQVEGSLDEIARFTELGDYLAMPIRTYSTGMILRLAFAISTAITPDILLLDEMIGAGDAAFISRADGRLKAFLARTGILVIASHNTPLLRQWCNKGMLFERGKLISYGPLDDVVSRYESIRR